MLLNSHRYSVIFLFFAIILITAITGNPVVSELTIPQPSAAIEAPLFITQVWSTTTFFVTCGFFAPAATLMSSITKSTVTTIQPVVTSYPATVLETVISKWTLEYQAYFSDPKSDYSSTDSGIYTNPPRTTILLAPPTITPPVDGPVTGSACACPLQISHSITPCGNMCCPRTWY
jgi:hypothetical protein